MKGIIKWGFNMVLLCIASFVVLVHFNVIDILGKASSTKEETFYSNKTVAAHDNAVVDQLYSAMLNRQEEVFLSCNNPKEVYEKLNKEELFFEAASIDNPDTSDDYDYLYNNIDSYTITCENDGVNVKLNWLEDAAQLDKVNNKVKDIIKECNINLLQDEYEIAKVLHDYIINVTDYDYSCEKYTAFNALFNNSTVCQGYSLLYYKLMTEAGIECRFVTGYSEGEYHGWNIVKIDNNWYNVDLTWDDLENGNVSYEYFLKGSASFDKDHKRDARYMTETFEQSYPISLEDL